MKKVLVVVDMQNDFVDGALGTPEAVAIVPNVAKKIREFDGDELFVTYDTHYDNYLDTLEGQKLPVPHCIDGTYGHELNAQIKAALKDKDYKDVIKAGFGSFSISRGLKDRYPGEEMEVEFVGLCTDICVVSNVLIMRAGYPNAKITVDSACCAGVTPQRHEAALETMRSCQIDVKLRNAAVCFRGLLLLLQKRNFVNFRQNGEKVRFSGHLWLYTVSRPERKRR